MVSGARYPIAALFGAVLVLVLTSGCSEDRAATAASLTAGDPARGRVLVKRYGCHTCHSIPGVRGADGVVGPPLENVAVRTYIAGSQMNTPETMIRFIRDPRSVNPNTAMPDTGASEQDSRDMAAYLYSLR